MQIIPWQELEDVIITLNAAFAPVPDGMLPPDNDFIANERSSQGITYFSDINTRSASGEFLKVPLLVGTNAQEGDLFVVALEELDLGSTIPGLTQEGADDVTEVISFLQ